MRQNKFLIFIPFLISILYWTYLLCTTSMVIVFDAAGYESSGSLIHNEGIVAFFKLQPEKVGLYPYIISISMGIAEKLSMSYQTVQAFIQILFLFSAQILIYKTLRQLNINKYITSIIVLYFGISPAMVNSALSLYSEIITYPFTLGAFLLIIKLWKSIPEHKLFKMIFYSINFSFLFALLSLSRAVNEYIFYACILTILLFSLRYLWTRETRTFIHLLTVVITCCLSFYTFLLPYKLMNYKYNGYKVLTSVGSESLYSTAIGRVRNLTRTNLLTFLANVAGERVCRNMFGKEECSFWSDEHDYIFGLQKTQELKAKNYTNDKINDALTALAIEEIMKKPFQYTFLTMAEGLKLVFWESTLIGYVNYPQWLQKIFLFTIFKNGLRLIIFFLTFISIMFSIIYCLRNLREIYIFDDSKNNITLHLLFMLVIIITNTALYAPFKSVPRYGFQVVPLYLITIGCMLDIIFARRR